MPTKAKAAFLEPHEDMPKDVDKWLAEEWDFDPALPYERKKDAQGWWWFFQDLPPESTFQMATVTDVTPEVK